MATIQDCTEGFTRTMTEVKALFGQIASDQQPLLWINQFGFHGYSVTVSPSHIQYLSDLEGALNPYLPAFDADAIERWQLMNQLLIQGLQNSQPFSRVTRNATTLAALVAFPTLEEIARKLSQRWDEDGIVKEPIVTEDGVVDWQENGTTSPHTYKSGNRIVLLSHKLQLMQRSLDPRLAAILNSLSAVMQRSMITGIEQPMSPLYDRLEYFRNHWLRGRRYEGWEALLVSMLLALIYFGSLSARLA